MKTTILIVEIVIAALVIVSIISCLIVQKQLINQKKQLSEIEKKLGELDAIENELSALKNAVETIEAPDNDEKNNENTKTTYKYFAIGNSITWHCKCSYWWNEVGMAASSKETDFVALVTKELEKRYDNVESEALNFAIWETQAHDRAQTYATLDPHLKNDLDLVTIQLSENASDLTTYERDLEELIKHVQEKCPNAEIILVDDFWSEVKSEMKKGVAEKLGLAVADLSEIRNVAEYQSAMGVIVYGDDGKEHPIDHEGVVAHPGDKGMKYIADAVIKVLK